MKTPRVLGHIRHAARQIRAVAPVRIRDGVGADLRMDLRRASAWYGHGTNEMPIQQTLAAHLRPGDTFYDIGANVGFFALIGARLVGPSGRVVAFEPVGANAAAIRRNASLNRFSNVKVVEAAVAEGEGVSELLVTGHPGGAALASAGVPREPYTSVEVPTVAVDCMVERGELPPPTLVKVDVEGAEREVLAGMARTASRLHPKLICEVDDATPARLEPRLRELRGMLESWGYEVEQLPSACPAQRWAVAHLLAVPPGREGREPARGTAGWSTADGDGQVGRGRVAAQSRPRPGSGSGR